MDDAGATQAAVGAAGAIIGLIFLLVELGLIVLMIAGLWKVFAKAGEPGWAAIVPIYNCIVMLKVAGKPIWWFILLLIPFVGIIFGIIVMIALAARFGKGVGYAIGMALLPFVFFPLLGFGDAQYQAAA